MKDNKSSFPWKEKITKVVVYVYIGLSFLAFFATNKYRKQEPAEFHNYPTVGYTPPTVAEVNTPNKDYNGFKDLNGLRGGGSPESSLSSSAFPNSTSTSSARISYPAPRLLPASHSSAPSPRLQPRVANASASASASLRQQGSEAGGFYSPERTGSGPLLPAGEQNPATGFGNRVSKAKQICWSSVSNCCPTSSSTSSTTDIMPFGYPVRLTTSPTIAPSLQMMAKRTPSATEQIRNNFPKILKTMLSADRIELDGAKKVYGVGLYPNIAQKRITNAPSNMKKELGVIMVCPLGMPHNLARADFEKQINNWNANHSSFDEQVWLNTSSREKRGDQARFSLPINDENIPISKIEFNVWKKSAQTAKIMLLGDVPYNLKTQIFNIIKKEKNNIEKSLPNLKDCTLELVSEHHYDHYLGSNDSEFTNISYETANTHHVPDIFNLSRIMDPQASLQNKKYTPETQAKLVELGERGHSLATSLAQDTVDEIKTCFEPNESELDIFSQLIMEKKNDIPQEDDDNLLIQQESSITLFFLQSTRLLEFQSRVFRVDLTHLNLPSDVLNIINSNEFTASDLQSQQRTFFEFQKVNKAFASAVSQTNTLLDKCQKRYIITSTTPADNLVLIKQELYDQFEVVTKLGQFQCDLLNLNTNLKEGRCAFELSRIQLSAAQNRITHALLQFEMDNGNPHATLSDIETDIENNVYPKIPINNLNTPESFQKSIKNISKTIKDFKLDTNQIDRTSSLIAQSTAIRDHVKTIPRDIQKIIRKESVDLTPIFYPV